jgi:hypothetical protein
MTIATLLRASLFCLCMSAAAQKNPSTVFACNLKAISAAERPRYNELVERVREAMRDRTEISNGYAFKLDSKSITLPEAAEWICEGNGAGQHRSFVLAPAITPAANRALDSQRHVLLESGDRERCRPDIPPIRDHQSAWFGHH